MLPSESNEYPSISIIILNYNGLVFIEKCLKSVFASDYPNFEVIFVDNGSTDGSVELVEKLFRSDLRLKIIRNDSNFGFAEGNNIGVKDAKGKYLAFLNNDTEVDSLWLREISAAISSDNEIAAAQCKLMQMDNRKKLDSAGNYIDYFAIAYVRGYDEVDQGQYDYICEIFGATGAALVVKKEVFNKVRGFDSDFFLTFEDTDLCWRIWLSGYKIVFIPKAVVYHKGGGTTGKTITGNSVVYFFCRNRITSLLKNYSLQNLFRCLPVNTTFLLFYSLIRIKDYGTRMTMAVMRAIAWNILHLNKIMYKRKIVQSMRKKSDDFLINKGLMEPWSIKKMIAKLRFIR